MEETAYRVAVNKEMGRHLVAARDLKKGEVILQEYPLATGPERFSAILCPVCNKPPTDSEHHCPKCTWPVCGTDCFDHDVEECRLFEELKDLNPHLYNIEVLSNVLMLLRLLLLKSKDETKWKHVLDMESNWEAWTKSELYLQAQNTTRVLRKLFPRFCDRYTPEEILHVHAALDINAYEVRMPDVNVQALYGLARLVEHNCCPNTHRTMNTRQLLTLQAAEDILEGTHITTSYCDALWSTAQRQEYLEWSKFFICSCQRCLDPSELSTELSSLLCSQCSGPMRPTLENKESPGQRLVPPSFKCKDCSNIIKSSQGYFDTTAKNELEGLDNETHNIQSSNIKDYENWLMRWTKLELPGLHQEQNLEVQLYPSHYLVIDCCHTLFLLYSRDENTSIEVLTRKIVLGNLLLDATKPLSSGIQKFRGTVMYELAMTKVSLFMSKLESHRDSHGKCDDYSRKTAEEAINDLKTALELLQFEPLDQPEGLLAVTGSKQLQQLETFLRTTIPDLEL